METYIAFMVDDKPYFIGVIDPIDYYLLDQYTYKECAEADFLHSFFTSEPIYDKIESGEGIMFVTDGEDGFYVMDRDNNLGIEKINDIEKHLKKNYKLVELPKPELTIEENVGLASVTNASGQSLSDVGYPPIAGMNKPKKKKKKKSKKAKGGLKNNAYDYHSNIVKMLTKKVKGDLQIQGGGGGITESLFGIMTESGKNSAYQKYVDTNKIGDYEFNLLLKSLDEINYKYLEWIIRMYLKYYNSAFDNTNWILGKTADVNDLLYDFEEIKPYMTSKDINYYRDDLHLKAEIENARIIKHQKEIEKIKLKPIYVKDNIKIYKIDSYLEACKYGAGTKWCITERGSTYYWDNYYNTYGSFYFIINNDLDISNDNYKIAFQVDKEKGFPINIFNARDITIHIQEFLEYISQLGLIDFIEDLIPEISFDNEGRNTSYVDQYGQIWKMKYDKNGNIIYKSKRKYPKYGTYDFEIFYEYDEKNRLIYMKHINYNFIQNTIDEFFNEYDEMGNEILNIKMNDGRIFEHTIKEFYPNGKLKYMKLPLINSEKFYDEEGYLFRLINKGEIIVDEGKAIRDLKESIIFTEAGKNSAYKKYVLTGKMEESWFNEIAEEFVGIEKYMEWGCREMLKLGIKSTILSNVAREFDELKPYIDNKDINEYQYNILAYEIIPQAKQKKLDKEDEKNAKLVYQNELVKIYKIDSYESACKYGANTKWCITERDNPSYWNQYYKNHGSFYFLFLLDKNNTNPSYKIAFQLNKGFPINIFNAFDTPISYEEFKNIFNNYKINWDKINNLIFKYDEIKNGHKDYIVSLDNKKFLINSQDKIISKEYVNIELRESNNIKIYIGKTLDNKEEILDEDGNIWIEGIYHKFIKITKYGIVFSFTDENYSTGMINFNKKIVIPPKYKNINYLEFKNYYFCFKENKMDLFKIENDTSINLTENFEVKSIEHLDQKEYYKDNIDYFIIKDPHKEFIINDNGDFVSNFYFEIKSPSVMIYTKNGVKLGDTFMEVLTLIDKNIKYLYYKNKKFIEQDKKNEFN